MRCPAHRATKAQRTRLRWPDRADVGGGNLILTLNDRLSARSRPQCRIAYPAESELGKNAARGRIVGRVAGRHSSQANSFKREVQHRLRSLARQATTPVVFVEPVAEFARI